MITISSKSNPSYWKHLSSVNWSGSNGTWANDGYSLSYTLISDETIYINDCSKKKYSINSRSVIGLCERTIRYIYHYLDRCINVHGVDKNLVSSVKYDNLYVSSKTNKSSVCSLLDTVFFKEKQERSIRYLRTLECYVKLHSNATNNISTYNHDYINLIDSHYKHTSINNTDCIYVYGSTVNNIYKSLNEIISALGYFHNCISTNKSDELFVSDAISKSQSILNNETIAINEHDFNKIIKTINEAANLLYCLKKDNISTKQENLSLHDTNTKVISNKQNDFLYVSDGYYKNVIIPLCESIDVLLSGYKDINSNIHEQFNICCDIHKYIEYVLLKSCFLLSSSVNNHTNKHFSETTNIYCGTKKENHVNKNERLYIYYNLLHSILIKEKECINISVKNTNKIKYTRLLDDVINVTDVIFKAVGRNNTDKINFCSSVNKILGAVFSNDISIGEKCTDSIMFSRILEEYINITDTLCNGVSSNNSDFFGLHSESYRSQNKNVTSILNVSESIIDKKTFSRVFNNVLEFYGVSKNNVNVIENRILELTDAIIENSNAVISDIIISENEIDNSVPAGYGSWAEFISGDYMYKDALIKCELCSKGTTDVALLSDYKVFVDLPDIQDHNVIKIGAAKTWVKFELEFYEIPEVTVTTVSSDVVAIPNISGVTLEGFYVELRNINGTLVSGSISWQALGY